MLHLRSTEIFVTGVDILGGRTGSLQNLFLLDTTKKSIILYVKELRSARFPMDLMMELFHWPSCNKMWYI
jgi:hypothetical protein